ncbi:uncharacterized protein [Antedon mediterranea]|uniref:uncharacterized protein n=1 Tax=Antedon mediterranea TaxID=105859 RepID=UPI003AF785D6
MFGRNSMADKNTLAEKTCVPFKTDSYKRDNSTGCKWTMMANRQGWVNIHRRPFKPEPFRLHPTHGGPNLNDCTMHEMKWFEIQSLQKVATTEKNTLPTKKTIDAEEKVINDLAFKLRSHHKKTSTTTK